MKYLRFFSYESEYQDFLTSDEYVEPYVCAVLETDKVYYKQLVLSPANVGDIAYWDGEIIKISPLSDYNNDLGTAVGVVVVPKDLLPDGKIRIVSLNPFDKYGNSVDAYNKVSFYKNNLDTDTPLFNYDRVPITDNLGSTTTGSNGYGYLPSDNFNTTQSFSDPKSYYGDKKIYIPSPYLGDELNPNYIEPINGYNALTDFNGLSNTQTLLGLSTQYEAANGCYNYKDATNGTDKLQWYLPAMGELGFLITRFKLIEDSIKSLGYMGFPSSEGGRYAFWSSSECGKQSAYGMFSDGYVGNLMKTRMYNVCAFAAIEL